MIAAMAPNLPALLPAPHLNVPVLPKFNVVAAGVLPALPTAGATGSTSPWFTPPLSPPTSDGGSAADATTRATSNLNDALSAWGTFIAALIAALALLGTAFQVRTQNRLALLKQLDVVDAAWKRWREHSDPGNQRVDETPLAVVAERVYEQITLVGGGSPMSCPPVPGPEGREAPWSIEVMLPVADADASGPIDEAEYRDLMCARAVVVGNVLARAKFEATNFREFQEPMHAYLNHMNDLSEKFETGVIHRGAFMSKFHGNIIRAAFHWEPYVLWYNYRNQDARHFMRVLSLGSAARHFHWTSSVQRQPVQSRRDLGVIVGPSPRRNRGLGHRADRALGQHFSSNEKNGWNEIVQSLSTEFRQKQEFDADRVKGAASLLGLMPRLPAKGKN